MTSTSKPATSLIVLGALGVIVAVAARKPILDLFRTKPEPTPATLKLPPSPEEVAASHLEKVEQDSIRAIDEYIQAVETFFADAKSGTRPFAEEALSWASKWRLVVDHVPFTEGGRHETYIRQRFEQLVFSASDLENIVTQVVAGYIAHLRSIENTMLVDLRADVADFPSAYPVADFDDAQLQKTYREAFARALDATGSELRADIATQLVSIVTAEVLTQVAVRMGASAGILSVGAASGAATFGIGLVAGLIVDRIVAWVWDWWADPKGTLAEELDKKLDEMSSLIVNGSTDVQGLRSRLQELARERASVRKRAILALLHPSGDWNAE